jgi:ABC-type transport system substrate-binding protein
VSKRIAVASLVAALVLSTSACGGRSVPSPSASPTLAFERGGTLRVAMLTGFPLELDPLNLMAVPWNPVLHRCCLSRTLMSYAGLPTEDGGTVLRPDLAAGMPEVSADGLTWTFRLKPGIRYAAPLEDTLVRMADVVRAIERQAIVLPDLAAALPILGIDDFIAERAGTISGLETPDEETLVVRLSKPTGDLGNRFALPASAPIPPSPSGAARLGIADGRPMPTYDADDNLVRTAGDYERFLVATGPYMFEGSNALDFAVPVDEQEPVPGYRPSESIVLVRNPAWDPATDELRPAYVDRIEIVLAGTDRAEEFAAQVDAGTLDMALQIMSPPTAPIEQLEKYQADPGLRKRLFVNERNFLRVITMNLAMPPFDDIHVRRAVNYAVDKAALVELAGGPWIGRVAGHVVMNSVTDGLLVDYDPFETPGHHGDLDRARDEMRQSRYDGDGDGLCDHPSCENVRSLVLPVRPFASNPGLVAGDLEGIGISLAEETSEDFRKLIAVLNDPADHVALVIGIGFGVDVSDASASFEIFTAEAIGGPLGVNFSMVGADPASLAEWGFEVTEVPNIDSRIDACLPLTGAAQTGCWAGLDQYITQEVVPWVPYQVDNYVRTVSARVTHYSYDQSMGAPALDQIALEPEP